MARSGSILIKWCGLTFALLRRALARLSRCMGQPATLESPR
jgi:hypothetical protein